MRTIVTGSRSGATFACGAFAGALSLALAACGAHADAPPPYANLLAPADQLAKYPPLPAPIAHDPPEAACHVEVATPPLLIKAHVGFGTEIPYSSNPPSSGPHYPEWTRYGVHTKAVDPRYFVHNLEHGAVVLLYKCDRADGCVEVRDRLVAVMRSIPDDPACDVSVRVRAVVAPDPDLDVPVAAVAWGWTYKAGCVDEPTLSSFVHDRYGKGLELNCENGF